MESFILDSVPLTCSVCAIVTFDEQEINVVALFLNRHAMEYNKDESSRCLQIATECLAKGDKEKASKLANKSYKLYPSKQAQGQLPFYCF